PEPPPRRRKEAAAPPSSSSRPQLRFFLSRLPLPPLRRFESLFLFLILLFFLFLFARDGRGRIDGERRQHPHRLARLPLHHLVRQEPLAHDAELARRGIETGVAQRSLHRRRADLPVGVVHLGAAG